MTLQVFILALVVSLIMVLLSWAAVTGIERLG